MSWKIAQRLAIAWQQSGVIPYRWQNGQLEILLVTTSSGKRWGIPKGNVEILMSPAESARKEAREEAGVLGTVLVPAIGSYDYRKRGFTNRVQVFWLRVETELETWDEASLRRRRWMSLEQAIARVKPPLKEFLEALDPPV